MAAPELTLDFAGSIFQMPASELTARPLCGSTAAKIKAVTKRRAATVELLHVMVFSIVECLHDLDRGKVDLLSVFLAGD